MPRGIPNTHPPPTTSPISALLRGPAGQNPDVTELPREHETKLIDEAREYYTSDSPVFLSDHQKPAGTVNKACLASEGTRALGVRVSVTTRAWSTRRVYQTIDLNGERVIVKSFKGGPRGCSYKRWLGVVAGFEKQPIAYAVNEAREAREAKEMMKMGGRYSLPGDDSEWLDLVTSDAKPAIAKPAIGRKRKSLPSYVDYTGDASEDESRPRKRVKGIQSTAATMNPPKSRPNFPRASVASCTAAPGVRIKQEPGAPEKHTRLPGPREAPSIFILQPANTSSVGSQGQASINNLSSPPTPPSSRDKSSGDITKSKHPSTTTTSSPSKAAAISISPFDPEDKFEELISNFLSPPLTTTTTTTTSSLSQTEATSSSSSSSSAAAAAAAAAPILPPQKQATTILSVYLNPDEDYVPLYLRSCMTISRFFGSCLGAFELDGRPETVSALRVRLEPIPTAATNAAAAGADEVGMKQQGASWLVKRAVPDSFDIFLEAVNKWAGWKDRESCAVRVEIVLRKKK